MTRAVNPYLRRTQTLHSVEKGRFSTDDQSISVVIPRKLPPNGKSFFRTLKREEVDAKEFRDLEELRLTHYSVSSIAITTKKDFTRLSDIGPGENSSG